MQYLIEVSSQEKTVFHVVEDRQMADCIIHGAEMVNDVSGAVVYNIKLRIAKRFYRVVFHCRETYAEALNDGGVYESDVVVDSCLVDPHWFTALRALARAVSDGPVCRVCLVDLHTGDLAREIVL